MTERHQGTGRGSADTAKLRGGDRCSWSAASPATTCWATSRRGCAGLRGRRPGAGRAGGRRCPPTARSFWQFVDRLRASSCARSSGRRGRRPGKTTLVVFVFVIDRRAVFLAAGSRARLGDAAFSPGRGVDMALRWYVVHAYSNFEHRVSESLEGAHQARRPRAEVRRDPGADRGSGRDARRPEAQERAQVLPGLRAGADGDGRGDLAPGARRAEGARVHRRHAGEAGAPSPTRKRTRSCAASKRAWTSRGRRCCSSRARWCA